MRCIIILLGFGLSLAAPGHRPALAQGMPVDGTYDATVTTPSGTYSVPVEVDNGEVSHVYWPNGGAMSLYGAELDGSSASGTTSDGDWVDVEVDDLDVEVDDFGIGSDPYGDLDYNGDDSDAWYGDDPDAW